MTKMAIVLACCLTLFGSRAEGFEPEEEHGRKQIVLVPVPLLGAKLELKKQDEKDFADLALGALEALAAEKGYNIGISEVPKRIAGQLGNLPDLRTGEMVDLLAPVAEKAGADGAVGIWLEGDVESTVRIIALLYLPRRIELQGLTIAVNLERELVPVVAGNIEVDAFEKALRAALVRNLDRIIPLPTQDDEENLDESGEEGGIGLVPSSGGAPASRASGTGGLTAEELAIDTPFTVAEQGSGARPPPEQVGVLPFSKRLRSSEQDLVARYGKLILDPDLQALALAALAPGAETKRLDRPTLTFEQLAAPANTLDPNYDPRAKLRRLGELCRAEGVDALIIGHLREEGAGETTELAAYIRLFVASPETLTTVRRLWNGRPRKSALASHLGTLIKDVFSKAGIRETAVGGQVVVASADARQAGEPLEYVVRKGERLIKITRRCYRGDPNEVWPLLCDYNKLRDCDVINAGSTLRLPQELGGYNRRKTRKCL